VRPRCRIERLERAGILAPTGPVDRVPETVVNNLLVTNNLTLEVPIKCRVLLTSLLESFTVGHTIVLSRGLIDVLPDEANLAMILGHELSHAVLEHQLIDTKFGFADRLMIPDFDLLNVLRFRHSAAEETAANAKVVALLKNSPYTDKLSEVGLFLRAILASAKQLPNLIQTHLGDYTVDSGQPLVALMQQAPQLAPERLDQIPVLSLGGRLVVDWWCDRLELLRGPAVPLASAREKVPLAVTQAQDGSSAAEPAAVAAPSASDGPQVLISSVEARRDRFPYHFDNPSSAGTPFFVPHFFEQQYVADHVWLVATGRYTAGVRWETSTRFSIRAVSSSCPARLAARRFGRFISGTKPSRATAY
jgi:hypothetical protein